MRQSGWSDAMNYQAHRRLTSAAAAAVWTQNKPQMSAG